MEGKTNEALACEGDTRGASGEGMEGGREARNDAKEVSSVLRAKPVYLSGHTLHVFWLDVDGQVPDNAAVEREPHPPAGGLPGPRRVLLRRGLQLLQHDGRLEERDPGDERHRILHHLLPLVRVRGPSLGLVMSDWRCGVNAMVGRCDMGDGAVGGGGVEARGMVNLVGVRVRGGDVRALPHVDASFALVCCGVLCFCSIAGIFRFVLGRQLRWVRKQFNEYETMRHTLIYLTLALFSYAVIVVAILDNHHVIVRRVAIVCESLISVAGVVVVFWPNLISTIYDSSKVSGRAGGVRNIGGPRHHPSFPFAFLACLVAPGPVGNTWRLKTNSVFMYNDPLLHSLFPASARESPPPCPLSNQRPADPVLTTHILLWGSIGEPFVKNRTGDSEYLWSYTKGFSELPSPAQVHVKRKQV